MEYEFPDGFSVVAQDLVEKLLVLDPEQRLGCEEMGGFEKLKSHPFYEGIDFEHIHEQKPPPLIPFLPATSTNPENIWSNYRVCSMFNSLLMIFCCLIYKLIYSYYHKVKVLYFACLMFFDCWCKVCYEDSPANKGTSAVGSELYLLFTVYLIQ